MDQQLKLQHQQMLKGLNVEIAIEIGTVQISLKELLDLEPGAHFQFPLDFKQTVSLRLGEEHIANGRFILQGDEILIEVTEIL